MASPTAQTASQVIADALVALNVIRVGQTPTADQQAQAIRKLNQMMAAWEADGKRLGYIPVGTVTDILTVPDGAVLGITSHLAIHMASSYGATISPELAAQAERGMEVIDKLTATEVQSGTELQPAADCRPYFNISSG